MNNTRVFNYTVIMLLLMLTYGLHIARETDRYIIQALEAVVDFCGSRPVDCRWVPVPQYDDADLLSPRT